MEIKAALLDFDGTLVYRDTIDLLCSIVGKEQKSAELNKAVHEGLSQGFTTIVKRMNLLKGVSLEQIKRKLEENLYLRQGARQLIDFFRNKQILTILYSANMVPILAHYQKGLGIDYVLGTQPIFENGFFVELPPPQENFKLKGCQDILNEHNISPNQVIAIGDSPGDKKIFEFVAKAITINPKGDIAQYSDFPPIYDDLSKAIPIIEELMNK